MKNFFFYALGVSIILGSCEIQEETFTDEVNPTLLFSTDTVSFDTLIAGRRSITKRLRIFNPNDNAVLINDISMAGGSGSAYQMILNGRSGNLHQNVSLLGGDSLLILIEITPPSNALQNPFPVEDQIITRWSQIQTRIVLQSWALSAQIVRGDTLKSPTMWNSDRPYVITGFLLVDSLQTLTLEAGTRVFMDPDAALLVKGSLIAQGDSTEPVLFSNSRFDAGYQQAPGQWDAIYLLEGSNGNRFEHTIIENGRIGLRVGTPDEDTVADVRLKQVTIRHMSSAGIQAFTSDVLVENSQIYNCGDALAFHVAGGYVKYVHCSLINNPSFFVNSDPGVQLADNLILADDQVLSAPLYATLINNVIWGSLDRELLISEVLDNNILRLKQNVIRFNQNIAGNIVSDERDFPLFINPGNFAFAPDSLSPLINQALPGYSLIDLNGKARDQQPDIGAFEYQQE